jgi:YwiC-like protein
MAVDEQLPARERSPWRAVAVPSEHGGWGLTLEPVVLGLLIAPSVAGAALGVAAFLAFLVRTPLKLVAVDFRHDRWLDRSRLALRIALVELAGMAAMVAVAVVTAGWTWIVPVAVAAPLVAVELYFDVRSRGRRLVPELCGSVGMASVAAVIVVASGESGGLAVGVWLVLAGRVVGAIPFVRTQITRLRRGETSTRPSDAAQAAAVATGAVAVLVDDRMLAGLSGLVVLACLQLLWVRRPPVAAKTLGLRQMVLGLALVGVTAIGVLAQ